MRGWTLGAFASLALIAGGWAMAGDDNAPVAPQPAPGVPVKRTMPAMHAGPIADWVLKQWQNTPVGSVDICKGYYGNTLPRVEEVFPLTDEQKQAVESTRKEFEAAREEALKAVREKFEKKVNDVLSEQQRKDKDALDKLGAEYREQSVARAKETAEKRNAFWQNQQQGGGANEEYNAMVRQASEEQKKFVTDYQEKMKAAVSDPTKAKIDELMKQPTGKLPYAAGQTGPGVNMIRKEVRIQGGNAAGGGAIIEINPGGNGIAPAPVVPPKESK